METNFNELEHNAEIINSRVGGFGGSDARLFISLGCSYDLDKLSNTHKKRIAVMLGIMQNKPTPQTASMQRGHDFENIFAATHPTFQREKYLCKAIADNFKTFAHADFYDPTEDAVYELKYSDVDDPVKLKIKHFAQLQWYYLLGVSRVYLVTATAGVEYVGKDAATIEQMKDGVRILSEALHAGWRPDVDPQKRYAPAELDELLVLTAKKNEIEARIKELIERLHGMMLEQGVTTCENEMGVAILRAPSVRVSMDTKQLQKEHPDIYSKYLKQTSVAGGIVVKLSKVLLK